MKVYQKEKNQFPKNLIINHHKQCLYVHDLPSYCFFIQQFKVDFEKLIFLIGNLILKKLHFFRYIVQNIFGSAGIISYNEKALYGTYLWTNS